MTTWTIVGWRIPKKLKPVSMCEQGGHLWILCDDGCIYQVESVCDRVTTLGEEYRDYG